MMFAIDRGNVPTYTAGCNDIVYLVPTVERMIELDLRLVFTDRNAVLAVASFARDPVKLDGLIVWLSALSISRCRGQRASTWSRRTRRVRCVRARHWLR